MRKLLLIASVAALAVPGLASAQPGCREQQHDNRVTGTVLGAVGGALLGGAISGRAGGAVIGGVAGGAVGNVAGGASINCADYPQGGYYDSSGVWHEAAGYYDSNGNWVDARPPAVDYSVAPNPNDYGADVAYTGARDDLSARESWLEARIQEGDSSGAISRGDADRDLRTLAGIRDFQSAKADQHDGLTGDDRDNIASKLDSLSDDLRSQWGY
ncbi:MAG TPA: hypothetical protein VG248_00050 [Caulobacteraceae bacterium]|jgi:hypothetical protein|nr:hypothetical protein [Caulobacteraceae bacterium]